MPAVVLGTDAFISLARATSAAHGLPHLPVALVPHPIGGVDPGAVIIKAEAVVDEVLAALTADPSPPSAVADTRPAEIGAPDDLDAFQEFAMARDWSDGMAVLPPTAVRVARLLAGRAPGEMVATLAPLDGVATMELIAVNAALAGAGPEHMPVIVAAVRALARPQLNLNAVQTTTHPCTPLIIVNGPVAQRLGIAGGANALGNGHRANAVIGRSVRLVLQNVGGARPGREDRATLGHPGKFAYCLAENEAASPWAPLHVERGFAASQSCVTVCGSEAPHNVNDHGSSSAEALVRTLAGTAATTGSNNVYLGGEPLIILGPEHAATIAGSGWSKDDLRRAVWEAARVPLSRFSGENLDRFRAITPDRFANKPPDTRVPIAARAEDIMVIVAGGPGKHSSIVPTFGATRSVTEEIV
ncbi:MAG TPA: hypothetical protein VMR23_08215 [Candidatus Limnocylindria bacterium]|nr:hypothetical protein [Candidatus Limnocylindria bacterium]